MTMQLYPSCLEVDVHDEQVRVSFNGNQVRLSEQHLRILEQQIERLADQQQPMNVALNLRNVVCVASSVLGQFVRLQRHLTERGGGLSLEGLRPHLLDLFEIAQLQDVFDLRGTDLDPVGAS